MKINLTRIDNRFGFNIAEDNGKVVCSSSSHYFLVPFLKSSYKYAWEACRDAWKLAYKHPYHIQQLRYARYDMEEPIAVEVSAEDMITDHYLAILRDLRLRAKGGGDQEERKNIYKEISMVVQEMKAIQEQLTSPQEKNKMSKIMKKYEILIQKYFLKEKRQEEKEAGEIKVASIVEPEAERNELLPSDLKGNVLDTYAEKICKSIQNKHPDSYYTISPNTKEITILDFNNEPILKIKVNDNLNVESIVPVGELYDLYPVHSVDFYQKYWKPIAESLGHFYLANSDTLLKIDGETLPDVMQTNQCRTIEGWNIGSKDYQHINIAFKGEKPIWVFEPAKSVKVAAVAPRVVSNHTEEDYMKRPVVCIDPKLESIYMKKGIVQQIMPMTDMILLDVLFPDDLGTVRLTESQIEVA